MQWIPLFSLAFTGVLVGGPPFWTRIPPGSPPDPPVDPPRSTRATYATRNQYVCLLDGCATIGDIKNHICMSFGCHRLWRKQMPQCASQAMAPPFDIQGFVDHSNGAVCPPMTSQRWPQIPQCGATAKCKLEKYYRKPGPV